MNPRCLEPRAIIIHGFILSSLRGRCYLWSCVVLRPIRESHNTYRYVLSFLIHSSDPTHKLHCTILNPTSIPPILLVSTQIYLFYKHPPLVYGTLRFNAASQEFSYNVYPEPNPIYLRSNLIVSYHLHIGLPKGLFPVGLSANNIIPSYCHLLVICRCLVDRCGSLGSSKLQIQFIYFL